MERNQSPRGMALWRRAASTANIRGRKSRGLGAVRSSEKKSQVRRGCQKICVHKNSDTLDTLLSRDGLAHRGEYLLIRWESHPPLFRHHLIAYPDAELAAVAFDQFRLYS